MLFLDIIYFIVITSYNLHDYYEIQKFSYKYI